MNVCLLWMLWVLKVQTSAKGRSLVQGSRTECNVLLAYSTVQSPWEANWFAASQEIPLFSRNPKVHYRTLKPTPPVSILGQPNPVHMPTSNLLEIQPNIIHPSTPRSPQWSPSLRFPHQHPIHSPLLTHTCQRSVLLRVITCSYNGQVGEITIRKEGRKKERKKERNRSM